MNAPENEPAFLCAGAGEPIMVRDGEGLRELPLFQDGPRHSPSGFAVGYEGSGPAELAYTIIRTVAEREPSPSLYQAFKRSRIAGLNPRKSWRISFREVAGFVAEAEARTERPDDLWIEARATGGE